jgi:hypothetical protein
MEITILFIIQFLRSFTSGGKIKKKKLFTKKIFPIIINRTDCRGEMSKNAVLSMNYCLNLHQQTNY